jgi:hypothetical protein
MHKRIAFQGLLISFFIAVLVFLATSLSVQAASSEGGPTAYIVLIDKLSINDIDPVATPAIYQLTKQGAVGLASNRTLRGHNTTDCSLTLGAGNLARGYNNDLMGFNKDETVPERNRTAAQLYQNLTGISGSDSALLMVNYPEIQKGMIEESVSTVPGALGEILRTNHLKVCVLGNGDIGNERMRPGIAVGMDARGQVSMGEVGSAVSSHSPASFLSHETNYEYISQQIDRYRSQADLIIIDLSDLARFQEADTAFPEVSAFHKKLLLGKIDRIVAQIKQQTDPQKDLLLLSGISPSDEAMKQKDNFTPVLAYGKGFSAGILTSSTSRRDYIVANTDIAPTVLTFFELKDEQRVMIGQAMTSKPAGEADNLAAAMDLAADTSTANRLRPPVIKGYVVLQIIIILLALLVIFPLKQGKQVIKPLIVSLVAIPLVLLPLNKIPMPSDWLYIVAAIILTAVLTKLAMYFCKGSAFKSFLVISFFTVLMIDLDIILGAPLIKSSLLGYDPMTGARYYGIGNEYMGILIGSSIAVSTALYERYKNRLLLLIIAVFFAFQCYLIAGPTLGANSDGLLTAPVAFLITFFLLRQVKINFQAIAGILGVVFVVAAGGTLYDMQRPVELQTHIGRAANQIAAGGWQEILLIIKRKVGMNLKLIRYTIWSYVFMVILLVLSLLLVHPIGAIRLLRQQHPYIFKGFIGIIIAAVVALLVNDSGIVAASTTSIYLVFPILLLIMDMDQDNTEELEEESARELA